MMDAKPLYDPDKLTDSLDLSEVDYGDLPIRDIIRKYNMRLNNHVNYVVEAGIRLGVRSRQIDAHDDSKLTEAENLPYALHFVHGGFDDAFQRAWLHHIHNNPHHWEYWLMPPEGQALEMPQTFALEMVADWMGSSMAYTGSWDMTDWLTGNLPRIVLHPKTAKFVAEVLGKLEYPKAITSLLEAPNER